MFALDNVNYRFTRKGFFHAPATPYEPMDGYMVKDKHIADSSYGVAPDNLIDFPKDWRPIGVPEQWSDAGRHLDTNPSLGELTLTTGMAQGGTDLISRQNSRLSSYRGACPDATQQYGYGSNPLSGNATAGLVGAPGKQALVFDSTRPVGF